MRRELTKGAQKESPENKRKAEVLVSEAGSFEGPLKGRASVGRWAVAWCHRRQLSNVIGLACCQSGLPKRGVQADVVAALGRDCAKQPGTSQR